jgi:aspartyl-tRNA(Asn)/glutamyl-tRNA(Gln) amidotransferase subunit B
MRSKEDAMDYRYFPDPDLLPLAIDREWIDAIAGELPELPAAMRERFVRDYGLPEYDASVLTASKAMATYYETVTKAVADKKVAANWMLGEVSAAANNAGINIDAVPVSPQQLAQLINRVLDGTINNKTAKDLFAELWAGGQLAAPEAGALRIEGRAPTMTVSIDAIIESRGLKQISDAGAIEKLIDEVLAAHPGPVAEFRAGKEKAFNSLVGQAMKATKGKANPQQVNEILRRRLGGG